MTVKTKTKMKSDAFSAIHIAAKGLRRVGLIDKTTMREYDALCIKKTEPFSAKDIKKIREHVHVSQLVFAR